MSLSSGSGLRGSAGLLIGVLSLIWVPIVVYLLINSGGAEGVPQERSQEVSETNSGPEEPDLISRLTSGAESTLQGVEDLLGAGLDRFSTRNVASNLEPGGAYDVEIIGVRRAGRDRMRLSLLLLGAEARVGLEFEDVVLRAVAGNPDQRVRALRAELIGQRYRLEVDRQLLNRNIVVGELYRGDEPLGPELREQGFGVTR